MASDRKVLCLLVFLYVAAINAETEKEITEVDEKKIISQEDKPQCVKKFVDWCNKIQYPQEGDQGLAIQSISYRDDAKFLPSVLFVRFGRHKLHQKWIAVVFLHTRSRLELQG
uniref:U7-Saltitoxin-Pre1c_1 n=1 Tax=Phidippus regius TaxID=1905328 RepID=A0A482Z6H5_9ARAC